MATQRWTRNDGWLQQRRVRGPDREGEPERGMLRNARVGQVCRVRRRDGRRDGKHRGIARHEGRRHRGALPDAAAAIACGALGIALVGRSFRDHGVVRVFRGRRLLDGYRLRTGRVHRAAEKIGWLGKRSREPDPPEGDQHAGPEWTRHG